MMYTLVKQMQSILIPKKAETEVLPIRQTRNDPGQPREPKPSMEPKNGLRKRRDK
jgi:hypothetical protein